MYLFFVRRYNDIDHIVPIIYRMAKDGIFNIKIFCINFNIDLKCDFRISFLEKEYKIKSEYYFLYKSIGFKQYIYIFLAKWLIHFRNKNNYNTRIANIYLQRFYRTSFFEKYYGERWVSSIITELNPSIVIFDWQKPKPYLNSFIEKNLLLIFY